MRRHQLVAGLLAGFWLALGGGFGLTGSSSSSSSRSALGRRVVVEAAALGEEQQVVAAAVKSEFYVRNLATNTTSAELTAAFESVGTVESVNLPRDRVTGKGRGFGFVSIVGADAETVVARMQGFVLRSGVKISVKQQAVAPQQKESCVAVNKRLVACRSAAEVLAVVYRREDDLNVVNLATAWARLARAGVRSFGRSRQDPRLARLVDRAAASLETEEWEPRHLAGVANSLSRLELIEPRLTRGIAAASEKKLSEFEPEALAKLATAFSRSKKSNGPPSSFYEAIAEVALRKIAKFNIDELCFLATALAKRSSDSNFDALFESIAVRAATQLGELKAPRLVELALACSHNTPSTQALFGAIATVSVDRLATFEPREAARLAAAFSRADVTSPELFDAIANLAKTRIDHFGPKALRELYDAFRGQESPASSDLLDAIRAAQQEAATELLPQEEEEEEEPR